MGEKPFGCNQSLNDFEKETRPRIAGHLLVSLLKKSPSYFDPPISSAVNANVVGSIRLRRGK